MLQLLIIWSLMLFECIAFGSLVKRIIDKVVGNETFKSAIDFFYVILIGFVTINTLVQLICLVVKISVHIQAAFLIISGVIWYYERKRIVELLQAFRSQLEKGYGIIFVIFLLAVLMVASGATWTDDTYGYHAQTVRWIEEVGTAKGIANIHMRLGYNSAVYAISALYGMVGVFGQSVRSINGFLVLVSGSLGIFQIMEMRKHKYFFGDCFAVGIFCLFYYLIGDISGLSNCCFSVIFAMTIILLWCRVLEGMDSEDYLFYLTLFIVYLATVKLNQASLGLLCAWFLYRCIFKERKYKKCFIWAICAGMIAGVWFVRNIFVSGYLVYPFYKLDLFAVDWKVPLAVAKNDYEWIVAWARTGTRGLETALGVGLSWMPIWFGDMMNRHRILAIAVAAAPICMILITLYIIKNKRDSIYFFVCIWVTYIYWLFSAPSLRFGIGWVLAIYALGIGCILTYLMEKYKTFQMEKIVGIAFVCMVELGVVIGITSSDNIKAQVGRQIDYNDYEYDYGYLELGEAETPIWFPVMDDHSNGHAGYWNFPATNEYYTLQHLEMRGDSLKEGFRTNYDVSNY